MSKLLDFKAKSGQPIKVVAKSATKAEITLYGDIGASGFFGDAISARQFSDEIAKLPASIDEITVHINSGGGDVFDGITIFNRLKQHKAKIITKVDGLAASIASIIALAGDEIHMGEGALFMIHLPWTVSMGDRTDLENTINRLMDVEEQMISIYVKRSGLSRSEVRAMLEAETWMDADQAIEHGFIDSKAGDSLPIAASAFDRNWITKRPKAAYKSETQVVSQALSDLKKKIAAKVARK